MIVLLESLLSENVTYFLFWKLTEVPIFFVSDADKVFEFWTKSYKYVFWENIWLCNNNTTWQKSRARITLVTEKSTQDFSDLDLSIDIKYLSCRLYDFDLCHLIMNCWKPDTRHTSLECFHSSQFASSMTLYNLGPWKWNVQPITGKKWSILTNQRLRNCQDWTMPTQWMGLKHFQDMFCCCLNTHCHYLLNTE